MSNKDKPRIWELDAARGLCILGMVVVHIFYDLSVFGHVQIQLPDWCYFVRDNGHILFVLISGICVTLASSSFQRGIVVFGAGLLISYVTLFLDLVLGIDGMRIWFGILHMLGICMMVYPIFKKLPHWALAVIGLGFVAIGRWFLSVATPVNFLFPIGLCSDKMYVGSDFVPLFPGLGWFLIGAFLGKQFYRDKKSLIPKPSKADGFLNVLQFCGKHSLEIYLIHQPILVLIISVFSLF